jgi:hypothetical protein
MQEIPLDSTNNQTFSAIPSVDGVNISLRFFVRWNDIAGYWTMSITDANTGVLLLDSIPLVTDGGKDAFNFLGQFSYLGIGSAYLVNVGGVSSDPSADDLGLNFKLLWGDTE